jgi:hypothetical protein
MHLPNYVIVTKYSPNGSLVAFYSPYYDALIALLLPNEIPFNMSFPTDVQKLNDVLDLCLPNDTMCFPNGVFCFHLFLTMIFMH